MMTENEIEKMIGEVREHLVVDGKLNEHILRHFARDIHRRTKSGAVKGIYALAAAIDDDEDAAYKLRSE